eukprot:TRINITY_DN8953_c0_g1_i2.p1 TRINITY_DN8953_c0_g1~~TRINITY_DN8953_c0_g1_i2.p1  ORF type:complete len:316 (-),score=59.23 TRINITY_DN8953_c0_g1_i2:607-1554(-)
MALASHLPSLPCNSLRFHVSSEQNALLPSSRRVRDCRALETVNYSTLKASTVRCLSATSTNAVTSVYDLRSSLPTSSTSSIELLRKEPLKWRRVLLKVSGEALAGNSNQNVDSEVALVVGGGNFFRGSTWAGCSGLDRSSADYIGMLATVMNALFLQASMESIGIATRVQTAFRMSEVAEPYIRRRAIRHLEKGRVVIFAAGTGNPFFTTDTAAALRCAEIGGEVLLKATNVDGVYDKDPRVNDNARLIEHATYRDIHSKSLAVMDLTAITLCQENSIPVVVFNLNKPGNIAKALRGERVGTSIGKSDNFLKDEV